MDFKSLQDNWNRFGESDPLWAILTDPAKKGGLWGLEGFFQTGRAEIAGVMEHLRSLPVDLRHGRALDFGCGVGRLTQALCEYFDECHGVDIAPSMIRHAQMYNRFGSKAVYHLNEHLDLSLFEDDTFDFVYTNLVLQHMQPAYHQAYICEFIRVLEHDGVLLFQLPAEPSPTHLKPGITLDAQALPSDGFRACVQIGSLPSKLKAGSQVTVTARVKNVSNVVWPITYLPGGKYCIRLGNHWLDREGRTVLNDDGRVMLPHDVRPNEEVELPLTICAPEVNGRYILELDMVQEHVSWFQVRGSVTARARVKVVGGRSEGQYASADNPKPLGRLSRLWRRAQRPLAPPSPEPLMEMYGTPKRVVIDLIQSAGGRVIDVKQDDMAGEEWISYHYCVVK
jgi:SAM-dependent methyltransferase